MPAAGLEPARGCPRQILSLMRLPFRHAGITVIANNKSYINIADVNLQVFFVPKHNNFTNNYLRFFASLATIPERATIAITLGITIN